jgi:hypothetical protein
MLLKRGDGDELPANRDSVHVQNYSMRLAARRRETVGADSGVSAVCLFATETPSQSL